MDLKDISLCLSRKILSRLRCLTPPSLQCSCYSLISVDALTGSGFLFDRMIQSLFSASETGGFKSLRVGNIPMWISTPSFKDKSAAELSWEMVLGALGVPLQCPTELHCGEAVSLCLQGRKSGRFWLIYLPCDTEKTRCDHCRWDHRAGLLFRFVMHASVAPSWQQALSCFID